ncbi:MAG: TetR/AcrR family transcriptional regulator [Micropruina sp.]|uniref:TetR/AcrR family transcriptional regulator n=1 Tax=Micropruina sp. TaxID=2737536 RepID=UPI0039E2BCC1
MASPAVFGADPDNSGCRRNSARRPSRPVECPHGPSAFDRFPAEQQDAVLDAAQREFATHGFAGASLNRIIQAAGVSKGTMYYYFDGKGDLYADVIRRQLERFAASAGALPVPQASDAEDFWATLTDYAQRMLSLARARSGHGRALA